MSTLVADVYTGPGGNVLEEGTGKLNGASGSGRSIQI